MILVFQLGKLSMLSSPLETKMITTKKIVSATYLAINANYLNLKAQS